MPETTTINPYRAHSTIASLADVTVSDLTIGSRLAMIREIIDAAHQAERRLLIQVGVDYAKHLAASGIQPTGRRLNENVMAATKKARTKR